MPPHKELNMSKTEIKLELSARRAELAAMHTRPGLSMVKYIALSQEIARLEALIK
jgi:hypothetical protein